MSNQHWHDVTRSRQKGPPPARPGSALSAGTSRVSGWFRSPACRPAGPYSFVSARACRSVGSATPRLGNPPSATPSRAGTSAHSRCRAGPCAITVPAAASAVRRAPFLRDLRQVEALKQGAHLRRQRQHELHILFREFLRSTVNIGVSARIPHNLKSSLHLIS